MHSKISYNQLPMKVRVDYFPVTDASVMTTITVQFDNKDLQFKMKDGVQKAELEILGTHHQPDAPARGHALRRSSDDSDSAVDAGGRGPEQVDLSKGSPLAAGHVSLERGSQGRRRRQCRRSRASCSPCRASTRTTFRASKLVLADYMQHVDTKSIGLGMFVLGDTKVRPRMANCDTCAPSFKPDESIGIYVKLYNFEPDENTHKAVGQVEYELVKTGTTDKLVERRRGRESESRRPRASQVTIEKYLDLKMMKLAPGSYTLRIKVTDKKRNQSLPLTAQFTVTYEP